MITMNVPAAMPVIENVLLNVIARLPIPAMIYGATRANVRPGG